MIHRMFHRPRNIMSLLLLSAVVLLTESAGAQSAGDEKITVHEWGTFTALQNARGDALPGINIDDEPVPKFVHNLSRYVLAKQYATPRVMMKGVPRRHPFVTLRLETPVIYFYPPKGMALPVRLDVDVKFRGGWLTEFYPKATADAPGIKDGRFHYGALTPKTGSSRCRIASLSSARRIGPDTLMVAPANFPIATSRSAYIPVSMPR